MFATDNRYCSGSRYSVWFFNIPYTIFTRLRAMQISALFILSVCYSPQIILSKHLIPRRPIYRNLNHPDCQKVKNRLQPSISLLRAWSSSSTALGSLSNILIRTNRFCVIPVIFLTHRNAFSPAIAAGILQSIYRCLLFHCKTADFLSRHPLVCAILP